MKWCNIITGLKEAAINYTVQELEGLLKDMNISSSYTQLTNDIFKQYAKSILSLPTFKEDIEGCILFAKSVFFKHNLKSKKLLEMKYKNTPDKELKKAPIHKVGWAALDEFTQINQAQIWAATAMPPVMGGANVNIPMEVQPTLTPDDVILLDELADVDLETTTEDE